MGFVSKRNYKGREIWHIHVTLYSSMTEKLLNMIFILHFVFKIHSNLISILSKQIQMTTTMKTFHLVVLNLRFPEKVLMKLLFYSTHTRTHVLSLSVSHLQLQWTRKLPIIELIWSPPRPVFEVFLATISLGLIIEQTPLSCLGTAQNETYAHKKQEYTAH